MTTRPSTALPPTAATLKGDRLRPTMLILVVLGLLIAGYMSLTELTGSALVCPGGTESVIPGPGSISVDCTSVNNSIYAKLLGVPVALIGFAGYLAIGAVLLLERRIALFQDYGRLLVFGMALFGFLFSAYLTYIEFFVIYMVCTWCLTQAVVMTLLFILSTVRMVQSLRAPDAE
jgi:uncharacterized membrane protein